MATTRGDGVAVATKGRAKAGPAPTGGAFPIVELGHGLTARLMEVTPELAQQWLARNPRVQRGIGRSSVDMIARAIDEGRWMLNGATIVFGSDGRLYDAQHRLSACVKSGKPIVSLVVWGVDPAAFESMDIGKGARTGGDALKAAGVKYATAIAGAVQLLWRLERGLRVSHHRGSKGVRVRISPQEIRAYLERNPRLKAAAMLASPLFRRLRSSRVPTAAYYLAMRRDGDAATRFFEAFGSGAGLAKGSPLLALRDRAFDAAISLEDDELLYMIIVAWNAWRAGQPLARGAFAFDPTSPWPEMK